MLKLIEKIYEDNIMVKYDNYINTQKEKEKILYKSSSTRQFLTQDELTTSKRSRLSNVRKSNLKNLQEMTAIKNADNIDEET